MNQVNCWTAWNLVKCSGQADILNKRHKIDSSLEKNKIIRYLSSFLK